MQATHLDPITAPSDEVLLALAQAPDGLLVLDAVSASCIYANEAAARLLGLAPEQALAAGGAAIRVLTQETPDAMAAFAQVAMERAPEAFTVDVEQPRQGGSGWIELTRKGVSAQGRWLIVCVLRDITLRKLERSDAERYRVALDAATDSILLIDSASLTYLYVNEGAARVFGLPRAEMMEKGVAWAIAQVNLLAANDVRDSLQSVIDAYPHACPVTFRFQRPDGTRIQLESQRRAILFDGRWLIVSVGRDVTESRAAAERLERLNLALNQAPDALMVMDPEKLAYVDLNEAAARLFGLPKEQMLEKGMDWVGEKVGVRTSAQLRKLFADVIASYPESHTETREFPAGPGGARRVEWTRRAVQVEGRWLIVGVGRDVTERHAEQLRLVRLLAAIDQAGDAIYIIDPETLL